MNGRAAAAAIAACCCLWLAGCTHGIQRSAAQRAAFQRTTPCPANNSERGPCPGYVVDHVIPLCAGGADSPSNMQWQTIAEGKAKDRLEIKDCRPPP